MTIRLLEGIQIAGVHQAVGSILTLTQDAEARHVSSNRAVYTTLPNIGDNSTPVMASKTVTGMIEILVAGEVVRNGVVVNNPFGMHRFAQALLTAEYSPVRVNCLGDSLTLGTYSNDSSIPVDSVADAQGYVGRLRSMLARRYNTNPGGFIPANDSRNTLSGTGAASSSVGPVINTVRTNNVTTLGGALPLPAAATITIPVPACTDIEVLYLDSSTNSTAGGVGANTGTFSYTVDGGGATTTTADNANPVNYKKISITGLAATTHSLVLTGVTGTCYIIGVIYHSGRGVIVSRLGLGGATCLDLTGEGVVTHLSAGSVHRIFASYGPSAAPVTITGSITNGSPVVTGIASTSGLVAGMPVGASAQIPLPCFVKSVDSATQITLTANATADNAARTMYVGAGTTIACDLWIIPIGHNDWQQQNSAYPTTVPVFKTQMQRVIDQIVNAGGCVLLVGEPKSNNAAPSPEIYSDSDYWTAIDDLVTANAQYVASIQVNRYFGTFDNAKSLGYLSDAGGVHPLKKGCVKFASVIDAVLP